ncbi:MAG: enoyl-CoA hydratase-related protein [Pseudomonadota bacterium]
MGYQAVRYEKIGHSLVITITALLDDQGSVAQISGELAELCQEIGWDEEIRVVILTGAGTDSFSMEVEKNDSLYKTADTVASTFWDVAEWIARIDRPVIAAIIGDATGLGLELVLACDVRIAADTSHFGLSHVKAGVIPWDGGTQRLSRVVGKANALELILTGKVIDAAEALRMGLVNQVVSSPTLMPVAMAMGEAIASKGPIALRYVKEAVHKGMDLTLDQGLHLEADLYLSLHTTLDRTEGVRAFKEKRKPQFQGR